MTDVARAGQERDMRAAWREIPNAEPQCPGFAGLRHASEIRPELG